MKMSNELYAMLKSHIQTNVEAIGIEALNNHIKNITNAKDIKVRVMYDIMAAYSKANLKLYNGFKAENLKDNHITTALLKINEELKICKL